MPWEIKEHTVDTALTDWSIIGLALDVHDMDPHTTGAAQKL